MQRTLSMAKNRDLSAAEQLNFLKVAYPDSQGQTTSKGFVWHCDIRPQPLSNVYRLKIQFFKDKSPRAFIESPVCLQLAKGATKLPHTYDTKRQWLCLFYPKYREWNHSMKVSETIVHWAILWMIYYESWVHTGVWQGGGHGNWDAEKPKNTQE